MCLIPSQFYAGMHHICQQRKPEIPELMIDLAVVQGEENLDLGGLVLTMLEDSHALLVLAYPERCLKMTRQTSLNLALLF